MANDVFGRRIPPVSDKFQNTSQPKPQNPPSSNPFAQPKSLTNHEGSAGWFSGRALDKK